MVILENSNLVKGCEKVRLVLIPPEVYFLFNFRNLVYRKSTMSLIIFQLLIKGSVDLKKL